MTRKKTNYAPHLFIGLFLLAVVTSYPGCYSDNTPKPANKIITGMGDERGLMSVIYVQNGDTLALDYLTPNGVDSLIRELQKK